MNRLLVVNNGLRRLARAASTAGKPSSVPAASTPASAPSPAGLFPNKPTPGAPIPLNPQKPTDAPPGSPQPQKGLSLTSIALPFLLLAGIGGGYYAYKQGLFEPPQPHKPTLATPALKSVPVAAAKTADVAPKTSSKTETVKTASTAGDSVTTSATETKVEASKEVKPAPTAVPTTSVQQTSQAKPAKTSTASNDAVDAKLINAAIALAQGLIALETPQKPAVSIAPPAPVILQTITPLETVKASHDQWKSEQVAATLRKEAETGVVEEVQGLSPAELRERVLYLSNELSRRAQWEAVHLIEMLDKSDKKWEELFAAYARSKDEEAIAEADARYRKLKQQVEEEYTLAVDKARRTITEEVQLEHNAKLRDVTKQLFKRVAEETDTRVQQLDVLLGLQKTAEDLLRVRRGYDQVSWDAHRLNAALLACDIALQRPGAATSALAALQVASGGDAVIAKAVSMFPREVHTAAGVPSSSVLQSRFVAVSNEARAAAMTPEGAGLLGQVLGTATSMLVKNTSEPSREPSPPPAPIPYISDAWNQVKTTSQNLLAQVGTSNAPADDSPLVEGARKGIERVKEVATFAKEKTNDLARVNQYFDNVDKLVAAGNFAAAVEELSVLRGYPSEMVKDWVKHAQLRVQVDRALSVAKARTALKTAALY